MKVFFLLLGFLFIAAGAFGDSIGLSKGQGFGYGQFFTCLCGLLLLAAGFSGRKFINLYKGAALFFLNTVLLLLALEFGALMAIKIFRSDVSRETPRDRVQRIQVEETGLLFPSTSRQPFVMWRSVPTDLPLMNVDSSGVRHTAYRDHVDGAAEILAFGGSTMWGWMVPDSSTIPSRLQLRLNLALGEGRYRVTNLAENGYVSTQDVIQLVLQLQAGRRPEILVFYNGINDVLGAYSNAEAGTVIGQNSPGFLRERDPSADRDNAPLMNLLESTHLIRLLRSFLPDREIPVEGDAPLVVSHQRLQREDYDLRGLAEETAAIYLANYRIVEALSDDMGFDFYFFLQPCLDPGVKPMTSREDSILAGIDPVLLELVSMTYRVILADTASFPRIVPVFQVLDSMDAQAFTDLCHMTPEGNEALANFMAGRIIEDLSNPRRSDSY